MLCHQQDIVTVTDNSEALRPQITESRPEHLYMVIGAARPAKW